MQRNRSLAGSWLGATLWMTARPVAILLAALLAATSAPASAQSRTPTTRTPRAPRAHARAAHGAHASPLGRRPIERGETASAEGADAEREVSVRRPATTTTSRRRAPRDIFDVFEDQLRDAPAPAADAVPPRVARIQSYATRTPRAVFERLVRAMRPQGDLLRGRLGLSTMEYGDNAPLRGLSIGRQTRFRGEWAAREHRGEIAELAVALAHHGHYFQGPTQRGVRYIDVRIPETRVGTHRGSVTDMVRLGLRDGQLISVAPYTESLRDHQIFLHGGR